MAPLQWISPNWVQRGLDINGEGQGDWSGESVAVSANGGRLAIGAPRNNGVSTDSGHVRVYSFGIFSDGFEVGSSSAWSATVP